MPLLVPFGLPCLNCIYLLTLFWFLVDGGLATVGWKANDYFSNIMGLRHGREHFLSFA